jgi:hypothetical protein
LETLSDDKDINRALGNIKEKTKTSAKESLGLQELKLHKLWFHEECFGFFQIQGSMLKCSGYMTQAKAM